MAHTSIKPFLSPLFKAPAKPFVSAGYYYDKKEKDTHGIEEHKAIDFDVPRGTDLYAPTDGYYVATYGEVLVEDKPGIPRLVNVETAKKGNSYSDDLMPPAKKGEWPIWFGGLFIQGWHSNGLYTQYGHLDSLSDTIPYYPPEAAATNLVYSNILTIDPKEYKKNHTAAFIKSGTKIGTTGMTGMGWGPRTFDFAYISDEQRPDFSTSKYTHYTSPHLHFVVFSQRDEFTRQPAAYYDPFNIYGTLHSSYPKSLSQWPQKVGSFFKK